MPEYSLLGWLTQAAVDQEVLLKRCSVLLVAGKAEALEIMPFNAGHLVGGCVWRITTPSGESIIYAPNFNNRSEHHLNPAQLTHYFSRPALVIAGACSSPRCIQVSLPVEASSKSGLGNVRASAL